MRAHRIAVVTAALAIGAVPMAGWADTAPGQASGSAVQAGQDGSGQPVASVSPTSASAGSGGAQSSSSVADADGYDLLGGESASGNQAQSGDTAAVGSSSDPAYVQVAPWSGSAQSGGSGSSSQSSSHVATVGVGSTAAAGVLGSSSQASSSQDASGTSTSGSSSTDAATVDTSGVDADVIHSGSGSGDDTPYLLSVNGDEVGTASQAQPLCQDAQSGTQPTGALGLGCDTSSGGSSATGGSDDSGSGGTSSDSSSSVADGSVQKGPVGAIFGLGSTAAAGEAAPSGISGNGDSGSSGAGAPGGTAYGRPLGSAPAGSETAVANRSASGSLPVTGSPGALLGLGALALVCLGGVSLAIDRRLGETVR